MLIFQIQLPAYPRVLKDHEVYAKKAVGMKRLNVAAWSLQPEKNILMVTPQSVKHGKASGVLSPILCVQYHAYRRANNNLPRPAQQRGKCLCQWFRLLCSQHCLVLAFCHILMERWLRLIQLPSGLGKNSSHGKTKGYKYHPNLPAATPVSAFCGK